AGCFSAQRRGASVRVANTFPGPPDMPAAKDRWLPPSGSPVNGAEIAENPGNLPLSATGHGHWAPSRSRHVDLAGDAVPVGIHFLHQGRVGVRGAEVLVGDLRVVPGRVLIAEADRSLARIIGGGAGIGGRAAAV